MLQGSRVGKPAAKPRKTTNNPRAGKKDPTEPSRPALKNLINIRNEANGKVYRFACGTCMAGHRAPQCNPNKHFDKILFRRPDPGRPPRDCGHPKTPGCDCKTNRELCCHLTKEQWTFLQGGGVPTAVMYNNQVELEEAMRDAERQASQARALEQPDLYPYQRSTMPHRPAPPGIHLGYPDQMVQYHPFAQQPSQPTHQLGSYSFGYQPAPNVFEYPGYQPQFQPAEAQSQNQNTSMSMNMLQLQQFAMDMGQQEQLAAQPSASPSQSCCSGNRAQPPSQSYMGATPSAFNLPGPAPRLQFPCQSCASFQCTCITCPEVRQVSSGAWQQSCGRGGHIDNMVLPKQEYSSFQGPQGVFQESQGSFQGYEGLQDRPQDYPLMSGLPEQQHASQSTLEAPQFATAEQSFQTQPAFDNTPIGFTNITDFDIDQALFDLQNTTHMSAAPTMPVDFTNIAPMVSEPMPFQDALQVNGAEHAHLPAHIQRVLSTTKRFEELSASPEAVPDNTVDPRYLGVGPQQQ